MTKAKTRTAAKRPPDKIRERIVHPTLIDAYDADWYFPYEIPAEAKKEKCVQRAIKEGWAEWIESAEDLEAVRAGYVFDLSRDHQGRTIYWHRGGWVRYQGTGKNRRLVSIQYDNEEDVVAYCGAADHMCRFAESALRHTKEPLVGEPYRFVHWQRKLCMTLFGWVTITETRSGRPVKYRRFREAMVEVPKKNGKSDLGSIIAVYLMRADYVPKSYVYGCACDRKQAGIVYSEAKDYVEKSPVLSDEIVIVESKGRMLHLESGSYYEVVSADAYRNDGYDALGVIFDELHRQKNRKLFTVMLRSGRARRGKHLRVVITTYGESLKGIWGEQHLKAKAQLAGRKSNYRRLVMIASAEPITVTTTVAAKAGSTWLPVWRLEQPLPEGEVLEFESSDGGPNRTVTLTAPAKRFQPFIEIQPLSADLAAFSEAEGNRDWKSDHAIRRANPSVDIVFPLEDIREDIEDSVGPEAEAEVKQLSLNIIAGGGRRWISSAVWQACARQKILMSSLLGQRCYGAGDFSFSNDLTAFWLAFPSWSHKEKFAKVSKPLIKLIGLVWVSGEGIEEREEREEVPYRAYAEMPYIGPYGYVRICEGATIDYNQVGTDVLDLCRRFKVQVVGYDPAFSHFIVEPHLIPGGLKCIPHRQGGLSMGPATKRFEELLKRQVIAHGSHPLLDEAVSGAVLRRPDPAGNRFPCRYKSLSRIDPLVSALMAVNWTCDPPQELKGVGAWTGKGTGAWE